ncbi:MAG: acetyl-CoA carboxylase biotin carboxyl carrier protein [Alphaproteobacteria bacterium]
MAKNLINSDAVRELADLLDETGLTEIEYETGTFRVRVGRQVIAAMPPAAAAAPARGPAPVAEQSAEPAPGETNHPGSVTSPMVGTVYTAPEPDTPDFVKIGDKVSEGQTLLLIEAMKTFNEIRSPRAGTVTKVFIHNEQPVEYGDPLLIVE